VQSDFSDSTFGIGAVARLTGIPMDTLRVWERRYNAVVPRRSTQNRRFYTRDDVTRLLLIKQLVEQGEPVGSIVHLQESELRERLRVHAELHQQSLGMHGSSQEAAAPVASTLVFGDALPYQVSQWVAELPSIQVLGGHSLFADFEREALACHPDILIMEFPALQADAVERIRELLREGGFRRTIVVYAFAAKTVLGRLRKLGVLTLRAPVTASSLQEACQIETKEHQTKSPLNTGLENIPLRRYTGKELAAIAQLNTRLVCECPQHVVDLVSRLSAFEAYSADCENRHAQDAIVHARLHEMTAAARAILEDALTFLLSSEGIELPPRSTPGESEETSATPKMERRRVPAVVT